MSDTPTRVADAPPREASRVILTPAEAPEVPAAAPPEEAEEQAPKAQRKGKAAPESE